MKNKSSSFISSQTVIVNKIKSKNFLRKQILRITMPRALDRIQLTNSEENILNNKGYEISAKLGEGAYAKVRYVCSVHFVHGSRIKYLYSLEGISQRIQTRW